MRIPITRAHIHGSAALFAATFLYASMSVLSRIVGYNLPLFYQSFTREILAVVLLLWTIPMWRRVSLRDAGWITLRSMAGAISFLLYFTAINAIPIGTTYFIFYAGLAIGGFAVGQIIFREHIDGIRIGSLALAAAGLTLVYGVDVSGVGLAPMGMAFASGLCTTVWNTVAKKLSRYQATQLTALDCIITALIYFVFSLFVGEVWPPFVLNTPMLASLTIGALFVATGLLVIYGFSRLEVQTGSLVMLSEILFALGFAYVFYREIPKPTAGLGGTLILLAMIIPEIDWSSHVKRAYAYRRKSHR